MSALEAAEEILAKLTRAENAQLLRWTANDLSDAFPGIESRPGVWLRTVHRPHADSRLGA